MGLNLSTLLTESARRFGERPALKLGPLTFTYAQLDAMTDRIAGALAAAGVGPGDRVAIMLPNVPQFPIAYYGALKAGAAVVPMNPLLKGREVTHYLRDSGAKVMVAWDGFAGPATEGVAALDGAVALYLTGAPNADPPAGAEDVPRLESMLGAEPIADPVQRRADDPAVLLYTSGTTGSPKGATLTHSSMTWNAHLAATTIVTISEEDVVLGALPLFHSFGQTCALNAAMHAGACLALVPRFDAEAALDIIEAERVTVFEGVPTMYTALLHAESRERRDLNSLKVCASGGSAIAVETMRGFEEAYGCRILEGYGLSETSPVASFNHPARPSKPGSVGTPIWGVEMDLRDEDNAPVPEGEIGEIVIRGHCLMAGYWNQPEATAEAIDDHGWFHSGDLARRDEDGFYFIVDRKKDMIIRGGYNVYPREVEELLYEHPAILEAAVVGFAHAELGEEVAAVVVAKAGETIDPDEVRAWVKERIAAYKYPRVVRVSDALPKGPTGKILKREIDVESFSARPA